MNRKTRLWIALWFVLVVVIGYFAFFHASLGMGYGPRQGWGMTDRWGYGDESYPAYRSRGWHGISPGWMDWRRPDGEWGAGRGYGMMNPYGAMPGMGLNMPGYPMMPWSLPELTPEQSEKIGKLQAEQMSRNRTLMQRIWETQARLGNLYIADKRDWNAIRSASLQLFDLQRQQHESAIELQQKMEGLLTDAQRQEMMRPNRGHGWMGKR